MKKVVLCLFLAAFICFTLAACTGGNDVSYYTVTFKGGEGVYVGTELNEFAQSVKKGEDAVAPQFVRDGFYLDGWDADFCRVTEDITVNAVWRAIPQTEYNSVLFKGDGGLYLGSGEYVAVVKKGEAAVSPAFVKTGYGFTGWDCEFSNVTSDLVVTATWQINAYKVAFCVSESPYEEVAMKLDHGSLIPPDRVIEHNGYILRNWKFNGKYWGFDTFLVESDMVLYPDIVLKKMDPAQCVQTVGEGIVDFYQSTYIDGRATLSATAGDDYVFMGYFDESDELITRNNRLTHDFSDLSIVKAVFAESGIVTATAYESGNGTAANPYIIKTAGQLALLSKQTNSGEDVSKYFKLDGDIDLDGAYWTPIGTIDPSFAGGNRETIDILSDEVIYSDHEFDYLFNTEANFFTGNFNGDGFTVSNFTVIPTVHFAGLFGWVSNSIITDLSVTDFVIDSDYALFAGSIAACAESTVIANCFARGAISVRANRFCDGIVATFTGAIYNCDHDVTITVLP